MEDFDKYLDRLVENFYDTGKLVLNETIDTINWDKIGKVIRDPNKSEQIYELLIDMFPNAKEVIDYNYYGDNEEPSPNDTFAEMKSFLWNIDKNTIKGPDLRLSTGFEIDGEYKKDLEKKYDDYVGGKIDKYFRDSSNDPRDTTKEGFKNLPPILVMGKKVIDGNHRTFLAQKVGAELPTFEMVEEPNTHPNAQKILSIIHPNDSDEDGIPNRLDISQEPNLNEHDSILDRIVEEFFDTGKLLLNEFTTNSLEMTKLRGDYYKILTGEVEEIEVGNLFDQWNYLTPTQQDAFVKINGLFDFETKLEFLRDNIVLIKEITNTFNRYKDIDFLREKKDVSILYNLRDKIVDQFSDEEIKEFLPDNIISLICDKIEEVESVEIISHETPDTKEKNRKNQIKQYNESDLPLLSIDTEIDTEDKKNNLKILQYILLNNFKTENGEFIDKDNLKEEIKEGKFGKVTKSYVELLQERYPTIGDKNGIVDNAVWNIALGLLSNRENEKFGVKEEISDELKKILSFQYEKNANIKEKLNKLSSMRLFNNLVDFGVYKLEHKRTGVDFQKDLNGIVSKIGDKSVEDHIKGIEDEITNQESEIKGIIATSQSLGTKQLKIDDYEDIEKWVRDFGSSHKHSLEAELIGDLNKKLIDIKNEKESYKNRIIPQLYKEGILLLKNNIKRLKKEIKEYKKYSDIIKQYKSGTKENKNKALQDYIGIRTESDKKTIKGLFGKLKEVFDRSVEDKDYSLDVINNIITKVNDTLYVINDKDIKDVTKKNKSKKALKTIINSINLKGDAEDIISGLERINTKTYKHVLYEQSFCECEDNGGINYFRDCGGSLGNTSRLIEGGNTPLKELIDSTDDVESCVARLYNVIIEGNGRDIVKHDIVANTDINLTDDFTINSNSTIEVKRVSREKVGVDGFTLSEFFSLFKNEPDRTNYKTPEKYNKYNAIIGGLVNRLNSGDAGNEILNEYSTTSGIFLKDYIYYEKGTDEIIDNSYTIEWSTNSDRAQLKANKLNKDWGVENPYYDGELFKEDEKRLTVKFKITGEGYKWEEGNCNIEGEQPTNESTDRIDNIIENFFDTGNFDI